MGERDEMRRIFGSHPPTNYGLKPEGCGCIHCDLGIKITRTMDGTPWHDTKEGSFVCEGPEGERARQNFLAAMRGVNG